MGYAGWVHMRKTEESGERGEEHFDTVSGTYVNVGRGGPAGFFVRMYVPGERQEVAYNEAEGVVRIGDLSEGFAAGWAAHIGGRLITVDRVVSGRPTAMVTRTREGALDRYEVSAPAEDGAACVDGKCARPALDGVLWAEAETGLVRRVDGMVGGRRMSAEYTYGEPAIRDVYDLGVPREARVVDNRADAETREVLERLRRRYEAGFGDYVAVATHQPHGTDGQPAADRGVVYLFARSGAAVLANEYPVGEPGRYCGGGPCEPRPPLPSGWPTPGLREALDVLKGWAASGVLVGDGARVWWGQRWGGHDSVQELTGRLEQVIPSRMAEATLPGRVWPTREYGARTKVEVVRDRGRPGIVGLRIDRLTPARGSDMLDWRRMRRDVKTCWFDPLRDDVPVETTWHHFAAGSNELEIEARATYTDWARTADGRWYPAAWRLVTRYNQATGAPARTEDWRLRVWAGERLGAEWFADPTVKGEHPPAPTASPR